ncbi:hypothetical protein [Blastochloris tepida]|uniref:Uncharacterized protein n=1 Tax=Blastochloris tepida TaxID=2233851 RepID=A0A348FYJ8_9HYPH|nr:hypothetical protein [Blastochloris tepida]BBF92381.1 hypothetical protein BLTE_10660 [Blastochloris tepida]
MRVIERGGEQVDLLPFVREAIEALGLVRPDALDWLAAEIAAAVNRNGGRSIREGGTRLLPDERLALGLPAWGDGHLSREVWEALTDEGRRDPVVAFDDTCARAIRAAQCHLQARRDLRLLRLGGLMVAVKMSPPPAIGLCAAGMAMAGRLLPEPPALPFSGCDRRVCGCSWRLVDREEAEKLGRAEG